LMRGCRKRNDGRS